MAQWRSCCEHFPRFHAGSTSRLKYMSARPSYAGEVSPRTKPRPPRAPRRSRAASATAIPTSASIPVVSKSGTEAVASPARGPLRPARGLGAGAVSRCELRPPTLLCTPDAPPLPHDENPRLRLLSDLPVTTRLVTGPLTPNSVSRGPGTSRVPCLSAELRPGPRSGARCAPRVTGTRQPQAPGRSQRGRSGSRWQGTPAPVGSAFTHHYRLGLLSRDTFLPTHRTLSRCGHVASGSRVLPLPSVQSSCLVVRSSVTI